MTDPRCADAPATGAEPVVLSPAPTRVLAPDALRHVVFRGAVASGAGPRLAHSSRVPATPATPPADAVGLDGPLAEFYERLFARHALRADRYRASVLRRRESACLRAVGVREPDRARLVLERDPAAAERALQAVAIGVTGFFRDPAVFESLHAPLRQLGEAKPEGLRVLSVGCSDGRELYSIAMLLDALGVRAAGLHGVDCRERAIRTASLGVYPASQVLDVPEALRADNFRAVAGDGPARLQVRAALRARCRWSVGDAFSLAAPAPYDVVLCRNLLIYLTAGAALELWQRLRDALAPGGLLIAGKAERAPANTGLRRVGACVHRAQESWS